MTQHTTNHIHCDVCEEEIIKPLASIYIPFKYYMDQVASVNIQVSVDIYGHQGHICESCLKQALKKYVES